MGTAVTASWHTAAAVRASGKPSLILEGTAESPLNTENQQLLDRVFSGGDRKKFERGAN